MMALSFAIARLVPEERMEGSSLELVFAHHFCVPSTAVETPAPKAGKELPSLAAIRHHSLQYCLRRVLEDIVELSRLQVCRSLEEGTCCGLVAERDSRAPLQQGLPDSALWGPQRGSVSASSDFEELQALVVSPPCLQGTVDPRACLEGFIPASHCLPYDCSGDDEKFEITWKLTESVVYILVCFAREQNGFRAWLALTQLVGVLTECFIKLACVGIGKEAAGDVSELPVRSSAFPDKLPSRSAEAVVDRAALIRYVGRKEESLSSPIDASDILCHAYRQHVGLLEGFLQVFVPGGQLQIMNVQMVKELAANVYRYGEMRL